MERDFIRSAMRELALQRAKFRKGCNNQFKCNIYWAQGKDVPLGAQLQSQIAWLLVERRGVAISTFCDLIVEQHSSLNLDVPQRGRGLPTLPDLDPAMSAEDKERKKGEADKKYFDSQTYEGWLSANGKIAPDVEWADAIVTGILRAADTVLRKDLKRGRSLEKTLFDYYGPVSGTLSACADLLRDWSPPIDWTYIDARIVGDMPETSRQGLKLLRYNKQFPQLVEALGKYRSVQVTGPHYSGKHRLLRRVVTKYRSSGFALPNGATISIFALSLHQKSTSEAISAVAEFYRDALSVDKAGDSVFELLAEIRHHARQFPALFIIAGLEAIDDDEVVRALHQDLIGEMVNSIIEGHRDTRLLVSTSTPTEPPHRDRLVHQRQLAFEAVISLDGDGIEATNFEYHALRQCAEALAHAVGPTVLERFAADLGAHWRGGGDLRRTTVAAASVEALGTAVAKNLLSTRERLCLGLVALSHDGLKPKTIRAIFDAIRMSAGKDLDWAPDPVAILDSLPDAILKKPTKGAKESCYQIERAAREPLLTYWRDRAPYQFRLACWGIARAAAREARHLRARWGVEVSAGRDVQVLITLLAAADFSAAPDAATEVIPESKALPPLDTINAPLPSAGALVRFAYSKLFDRDLARSVASGASTLDDATLRLAAVFPFLNNRLPWVRAARTHFALWSEPNRNAPWVLLAPVEQLSLLTFAAAAAGRLNLRFLISGCARLAENVAAPLIENDALDIACFKLLARIQRYELDFAILLGRNPDAPLKRDSDAVRDLEVVELRILHLIDAIPEPLLKSGVGRATRRMFVARHAEVLHLKGAHVASYWRFLEAIGYGKADEEADAAMLPHGARSRRMFTRLLVELTRSRLFGPESWKPVVYRDGLAFPVLHRAEQVHPLLLRAQHVAEDSLRRLSLTSTNDLIGAKIDQARLAAVQLRYTEALSVLDQARHLVRLPSASRDVVLEYISVAGRTLADAAAFAMATGGMSTTSPRPDYEEELKALAVYLDIEMDPVLKLWKHANAVSVQLCHLASAMLLRLKGLVLIPDSGVTRYAIYAEYLDVWLTVIYSRQWIDLDDPSAIAIQVHEQLVVAGERLKTVIEAMMNNGYFLAHREVRLLVKGLKGAKVEVLLPPEFPGSFDDVMDIDANDSSEGSAEVK